MCQLCLCCDISICDDLHVAVDVDIKFLIRNNHLVIVQFLVNGKYCNPDFKGKNGLTPLNTAITSNNNIMSNVIVEGGAGVYGRGWVQ